MTGYLDDSYDNTTVVCGGWIARDQVWDRIQPKWSERLDYENRISAKHGLKRLTRYHAADCANLLGEFEGWKIDRQIRLTKRLIAIMTEPRGSNKPMVFSWGISLSEVRCAMTDWRVDDLRRESYKYCVRKCIWEIGRAMYELYPDDKITFIHDSGPLFPSALAGFEELKSSEDSALWRHQIVTIAPMDWQQCVALQPADMVAYDSFKVVKRRLRTDPNAVRKSLEALVGKQTPIAAGYMGPGAFKQILEDWQRRQKTGSNLQE